MADGERDRPVWPETPLDGGRGVAVPFGTKTLLIAAAAGLLFGIVAGSFLGFLFWPLLLVPFGVALAGGIIAARRGWRAGNRLESRLGGAAAVLGGALLVWSLYRFLSVVLAIGLNLYLDLLYESFAESASPATIPAPGAYPLPPDRAWISTDPEYPAAPAGRPASPA